MDLDLVVHSHNSGELKTNAQAILDLVRERLSQYKAENYTDENIDDAKKDKAELNKATKSLNDARIAIEKKHAEAIGESIAIIKQAVEEIKTASSSIDTIVKDVEGREKEEKKKAIEGFFNTHNKNPKIPFSIVFASEMLNKGYKLNEAMTVVSNRLAQIDAEVESITGNGDPNVLSFYYESFDMALALSKANKLKKDRESFEVLKEPEPVVQKPLFTSVIEPSEEKTELLERTFWVKANESKLIALGHYMAAMDIEFKKL